MGKMIYRFILVCAVALSLTIGCSPNYGRVKIDDKSIEVEAGKDREEENKPNHCPPGHRKKGWC